MINIIMHARTKNQRPMPFKGQEVYFSVHEPVTTINRHPPLAIYVPHRQSCTSNKREQPQTDKQVRLV